MAACQMSEIFHQHTPVLLQEAVTALVCDPCGTYIDATFGRGSHTQAILQHLTNGKLIAFDKDQAAITFARQNFSSDPRFSAYHSSFANLEMIVRQQQLVGKINGILFDLGVSSPQLDDPNRGFSFMKAGALDMRMNQTQGITAAEWLKHVDEKTLATVLWEYGEEKFSRKIARAIVTARAINPIETTLQLSEIIKRALPKLNKKHYEKHPATRSFQAIRIFINQELEELKQSLVQALQVLAPGGRLAIISFHSLEDRIVKQFIKDQSHGPEIPRDLPIKGVLFSAKLKTIGKPIKPSMEEMEANPRSRSAILRIAEKQA